MAAEKSFFQLLREHEEKKKILWAPCVYDCISAKCAERIGFEALTISSSELAHAFCGVPSGHMNFEEMLIASSRISASVNIPVLMDAEDGGGYPEAVYRNVKRFAENGIMGVTIEDSCKRTVGVPPVIGGPRREVVEVGTPFLDADLWATNVKAAVEAVKGTDCMVIARTDCKGSGSKKFEGKFGYGLEEAIRRAQMGVEAGAAMTMIQNICYPGGRPEWEEIQRRVPGWHVYPDLHSDNGVSDVEDVQELFDLGFQMITCHCFQKGATKGMLEYGRHIFHDRNTIFTENDSFGYPIWQLSPMDFSETDERSQEMIKFYRSMKDYKAK